MDKKKIRLYESIDMNLDEIKEIDKTIEAFSNHMSEEEFYNSKEVEKLYNRLKEIGLDLFYAGD